MHPKGGSSRSAHKLLQLLIPFEMPHAHAEQGIMLTGSYMTCCTHVYRTMNMCTNSNLNTHDIKIVVVGL